MEPDDDPTLPNRVRAADALRAVGHALVGHHLDDDVLTGLAGDAEAWLPRLEAGDARNRPVDDMKKRLFEDPVGDGAELDHFPDCIVSGPANPMGVNARFHRDGEDAVARFVLGAAFEGAPRRAHGGIVAAVFDDAMGMVLKMIATPAYTGELTVRYLAPTPVNEELEFRARLVERDGRKLRMEAEARHDGHTVATATGLFIAIPPERFGLTG